MTRRNTILSTLAGLALVALAVWAFSPKPIEVELFSVARGPFVQSVDEDGKTRVRDRYVVSAPLAGKLERIRLKAGDVVEKDTVLAVMQPAAPGLLDARTERELRERLGAAEADERRANTDVLRARAAFAQSEADLNRTRKLAQEGFVSPTQLEREGLNTDLATQTLKAAEFARHAAEHQVAQARAALLQSQRGGNASRWEIRSPVAGRVLKVVQENEGVVVLGAPLIELADPSQLELIIDVLTADALAIKPGARVMIDRGGGSAALEARVRLVEPAAFTKISALGVEEQRVNVVVDLTSPPAQTQGLGDGFRVDARIIVATRDNTVKVPVSALFRNQEGWAVFVNDAGRARQRAITLGPKGSKEAVIEAGLKEGEQIVLYPSDQLRDGSRIRARKSA